MLPKGAFCNPPLDHVFVCLCISYFEGPLHGPLGRLAGSQIPLSKKFNLLGKSLRSCIFEPTNKLGYGLGPVDRDEVTRHFCWCQACPDQFLSFCDFATWGTLLLCLEQPEAGTMSRVDFSKIQGPIWDPIDSCIASCFFVFLTDSGVLFGALN